MDDLVKQVAGMDRLQKNMVREMRRLRAHNGELQEQIEDLHEQLAVSAAAATADTAAANS